MGKAWGVNLSPYSTYLSGMIESFFVLTYSYCAVLTGETTLHRIMTVMTSVLF